MLLGVNDTVRRALQADGYVPATFAEVWIGDTVVWEKGVLADKGIRYFTTVSP